MARSRRSAKHGALSGPPDKRTSSAAGRAETAKPVSTRAWDRAALCAVLLYTAVLLWVSLAFHATPLYGVESDLIGEYIPAARDLAAGAMHAEHYQFHGFGYPLLLSAAGFLTGGDHYLAARLINVAAAGAGAGAGYLLVSGFLGAEVACFTLLALLVHPVFVRATLEAVTDMPSFALALAATWLLLSGRRRALAVSGFLAGLAIVTRYNNLFLLIAAAIVLSSRAGRWRSLALYAAGACVPIGAWLIASRAMTGDPFGHINYMNVAYEIYGQGMNWDRFWAAGRAQFHSLRDVLLYQPVMLTAHVGGNLATRWLRDAHELMPVWVGALSVPGMLLSWRRPGWSGLLIHFALCYLSLTLVFYSPRFFLYLLPFYLSGVAGLVLLPRLPFVPPRGTIPAAPRPWLKRVRLAVLVPLLGATAASAIAESRQLLAGAPDEVRLAAPVLRSLGLAGASLMARKPHAAYFAGMKYVPLPDVNTFEELIAAGPNAGAQYLFFSPIEGNLRQQFALLGDEGVRLPGLEQVAYRAFGPRRFFAVYRFNREHVAPETFQDSLLAVIRRYAEREPGEAWRHTYLAGHLLNMGRFAEALGALALSEQLDSHDVMVPRMQTIALTELGRYDEAARACERAGALDPHSPFEPASLGRIRLLQRRYAEARELLVEAVRLEPTNPQYAHALGLASFHSGDMRGASHTLEKLLETHPEDDEARLYAARARAAQGEVSGALRLLEPATGESGGGSDELRALGDSLRRAMKRER